MVLDIATKMRNMYLARTLLKVTHQLTLTFTCLVILWCNALPAFAQVSTASQQQVQPDLRQQLDDITEISLASIEQVNIILQKANRPTSILARAKLAYLYRELGELEEAKRILNALIAERERYSPEIQLIVLRSYASFERAQNRYESAQQILEQQALPIALKYELDVARIYWQIGLNARYQYKLSDAKYYYLKAVELYQAEKKMKELAGVYASLGVMYESMDDMSNALLYQNKARKLYLEHGGSKSNIASSYFNIGEIFYKMKDYEQSLSYFEQALAIDKEVNDLNDMAYDYHRIGTLHMMREDYQQAIVYTEQAIKIFSELNASQTLARAYVQLAEIYQILERPEDQLSSLNLAQSANNKAPNEMQQRWIWHGYAQYYFQQEDLPNAEKFAQKALANANDLDVNRFLYQDNLILAKVYATQSRHALSYQHLDKAHSAYLEIASEEQIKESARHKKDITLLEEQLRVEQLKKEAAQQSRLLAEEQTNRQRSYVVFAILLMLLIVALYLISQRRKIAVLEANLYADVLNQKDKLLADVSHELRTPLTALKIQIDALQHNIVDDVDASYQKLGAKVMDLNRLITDIYQLAQADTGELNLELEEHCLTTALLDWSEELEDYVLGKELIWQQSLQSLPSLVKCDLDRVRQVLQNLVANSCSYTDKPGTVKLATKLSGKQLIIVISDSAPSVDTSELKAIFSRLYRVEKSRSRQTGGSGLGLSICQSLINAHHGEIYAEQSSLGGLKVVIKLPLSS